MVGPVGRGDEEIEFTCCSIKYEEEVLQYVNDSQVGWHLGCDKTLAMLKWRLLGPGLARYVGLYIKTCQGCRVGRKQSRKPKAPLKNYQAGHPGDQVYMDILGPFSQSEMGKQFMLMIIDQFSRWVEIILLTVQDAESVAHAFCETRVVCLEYPLWFIQIKGKTSIAPRWSLSANCWKSPNRTTPDWSSSNEQVECCKTIVLNFLHFFLQENTEKEISFSGWKSRLWLITAHGPPPTCYSFYMKSTFRWMFCMACQQ